MEQVMKHYGNAILAIIVLLALGAIIIAALSSDGYVAVSYTHLDVYKRQLLSYLRSYYNSGTKVRQGRNMYFF